MSLSNPEVFEAERRSVAGYFGRAGGDPDVQRRLRSQRLAYQPALRRPLGAAENAASDRLARYLLSPDNLIFAEKARAAGVEVEVVYEEGMFHVWPLIDMPEARRARDSIVTFLAGERQETPRWPRKKAHRAIAGRLRRTDCPPRSTAGSPSCAQNLPVSRNSSNVARMWSAAAFTGALASGATNHRQAVVADLRQAVLRAEARPCRCRGTISAAARPRDRP